MKIMIDDGKQICRGTGIGKYSLYLYRALKENNCDAFLVPQNCDENNRSHHRFQYLSYINSKDYQNNIKPYDFVLFTNYVIPFRKSKNTKYAVTIHDLVAFLYPRMLPFAYCIYNRIMIRHAIKKADLIFTVSNSVKKEIQERFPRCKHKLRMTWEGLYEGIHSQETYLPYDNPLLQRIDEEPYFLFVSTVEKRKNIGIVLDAFLKMKANFPKAANYKLVIVGRPGYGYKQFKATVDASAFREDITFAGYTSDADCNRLYNHARAFVFPTVYEGFGFAQIECMKCHLPIILSDIPTNREISREYGEFFDLDDPQSLVTKMQMIVLNEYDYREKEKLADKYLIDFNWKKIAKQYEDYFKEVVGK